MFIRLSVPRPGANRRQGGIIHVRTNPEAREQARDDLVAFFIKALNPTPPQN